MKNIEWWRSTAQHMWRTYFALKRQQEEAYQEKKLPPEINDADELIYNTCDKIFQDKFVRSDQDILKMYFTSRWGDDLYAVEDYSLKHDIPVKVIWIVIRKANRFVIEDVGLLERKGDDADDKV